MAVYTQAKVGGSAALLVSFVVPAMPAVPAADNRYLGTLVQADYMNWSVEAEVLKAVEINQELAGSVLRLMPQQWERRIQHPRFHHNWNKSAAQGWQAYHSVGMKVEMPEP